MAKRSYNADLPGGTATTTIQIQGSGTLKVLFFSLVAAAAGSVEVSKSASSQIGTAQPTADVLTRLRIPAATTGTINVSVPVEAKLVPFQSLYIHQTGTGNLGQVQFVV